MRVLVTGGAGYLGSILSRKLLEKGHQVRIMDALWYGKSPIESCLKNDNCEIIQEDIRNLNFIVKALKDVDAVIHLASIVGMPASSIEPRTSEEINYLATKNLAELCQLHDIETFIFASTCSVYGSQPDSLITEKSKISPLDYYAKSKLISERSIYWLKNAPLIFRFGTLFGISPRMRFDLVINLFIVQALTEGKITVFGGNQHRPFLHVSDAADSLVFGLEENITGTFNVISENFTIMEAAKKISEITGCKIKIDENNEDKRDYRVSGAMLNKMGFSPTKKIEDAIDEIKKCLKDGTVKNYKESIYNNYNFLFGSKEMQEKVFIQGL